MQRFFLSSSSRECCRSRNIRTELHGFYIGGDNQNPKFLVGGVVSRNVKIFVGGGGHEQKCLRGGATEHPNSVVSEGWRPRSKVLRRGVHGQSLLFANQLFL